MPLSSQQGRPHLSQASEAVAGGLLEAIDSGDISLEEAIELASEDPNFDGHCSENC